jgi:hypothetical protein
MARQTKQGLGCCKPSLEQFCGFCAFHAPANGIECAATQTRVISEKSQPIRNAELLRERSNFQTGLACAEEAFLKGDAQDFFAKNFDRLAKGEHGLNAIPPGDIPQMRFLYWSRKFKEVQRAFDAIQGKKARMTDAAEIVLHVKGLEWKVHECKFVQWPVPRAVVYCGETCAAKFAKRLRLRDVGR